MSVRVQTRLLSRQSVTNNARDRAVFESNGKAFSECADRIVISNSHGVAYFACLSGRSCLSPGERSILHSDGQQDKLFDVSLIRGRGNKVAVSVHKPQLFKLEEC